MKIVGLTGGIASGKSTVSKYLTIYGVPIIDCDLLARRVVEPGRPALARVVAAFGAGVLNPNGTLNRCELARAILADPQKRLLLNRILHPAVRREIVSLVVEHWLSATPMLVIEAPLLIESGLHRYMSEVVAVYCPEELLLHRLCARDSLSLDEARKKIATQDNLTPKLRLATYVVDNSTNVGDLLTQIDDLVAKMTPSAWRTWFWLAGPPLSILIVLGYIFWKIKALFSV